MGNTYYLEALLGILNLNVIHLNFLKVQLTGWIIHNIIEYDHRQHIIKLFRKKLNNNCVDYQYTIGFGFEEITFHK